jgi:hypothetical protein
MLFHATGSAHCQHHATISLTRTSNWSNAYLDLMRESAFSVSFSDHVAGGAHHVLLRV